MGPLSCLGSLLLLLTDPVQSFWGSPVSSRIVPWRAAPPVRGGASRWQNTGPQVGDGTCSAAVARAERDGTSRERASPAASPSKSQVSGVTRRQVVGGSSALLLALGLVGSVKRPEPASAAGIDRAQAASTRVFKGGIEKSPADTRAYRALTLSNGLRVLLVSDPETERAAAAMDVHVGHFSDPDDLPGLAHFCEHMLFLGTEKYPDEASYSQFLSAHGGSSNAYTDTEDTVYYFDVDAKSALGALDRFSEFFKAPLFTASATDRELNAIESENAKNLQSDGFRLYQLEKSRASPLHPYSKFGTGNRQTLFEQPKAAGKDVRDALIDFHKKYYIAPRMTLVVVAAEPLDQIQRWADSLFAKVPSRPFSPQELEPWKGVVSPFSPQVYDKAFEVVPVQEVRQLNLAWLIPFKDDDDRRRSLLDKPEYYVSHLIGHEGEGSLLSYLRRKGLANGVSAGYSSEVGDFSLYEVAVDLTEQGEKQLSEVEEAVFGFIGLIRSKGVPTYVYDECKRLADLSWTFQERAEAISLASTLCTNMQNFDEARYLSGSRRLFAANTTAVTEFLERMQSQQTLVTLVSKSFEGKTDKKEKWYDTNYKEIDVQSRLASLQRSAQVPLGVRIHDPNPYLPQDLSLRAETVRRPAVGERVPGPKQIWETDSWTVFHKLDRTFAKPKVYAVFEVAEPAYSASPRSVALSKLFKLSVEDSLTEFAYPATIAGLSYSLDVTIRGLRLVLGGYNDKLPAFASEVASRIANHQPTSTQDFDRLKDIALRELQSFDKQQPYLHAGYFLGLATESPKWPIDAVKKELAALQLKDLVTFSKGLNGQAHGTALIQGNVLESEAVSLAKSVAAAFDIQPLPLPQRPRRRVVELPITSDTPLGTLLRREELNKDNTNAAVEVVFQIGSRDRKDKVTVELLSQLIEQPFYDDLRTRQQLGYLVFSGVRVTEGIPYLVLIVQSNVADAVTVTDRITDFVEKIIDDVIKPLTEEQFDSFVVGLVGKKLERDKRLDQEASRHWEEISFGTFQYDRAILEAEALKYLTKQDVFDLVQTYIQKGGGKRRLITAQVFPRTQSKLLKTPVKPNMASTVIEGTEQQFRDARPVYGDPTPEE